jgi:hypothetical protein
MVRSGREINPEKDSGQAVQHETLNAQRSRGGQREMGQGRQRRRVQARHLFNSKAGGHGREPTSQGRFLLRRGYGRQVEGQTARATKGKRGAYICFCETNPPFWRPTFFVSHLLSVIYVVCSDFLQVGSFWKTNPILGGIWGRFNRKVGSFVAETALPRGVQLRLSVGRCGHDGAPKRIRGRRGPPY